MRKSKGGKAGTAAAEQQQGYIGVQTRARALALQNSRLRIVLHPSSSSSSSSPSPHQTNPNPPPLPSTSYLELRNRRLHKAPLPPPLPASIVARQGKKVPPTSLPSPLPSPPSTSSSCMKGRIEGSDENSPHHHGCFSPLLHPPPASASSSRGPLQQLHLPPRPSSSVDHHSHSIGKRIITRNQRKQEKRQEQRPLHKTEDDMDIDCSDNNRASAIHQAGQARPSCADSKAMEVEQVSFSGNLNPNQRDDLSARESIRESTPTNSYMRDSEAPGSATRPPNEGQQERSLVNAPPYNRVVEGVVTHDIEDFLAGAEQIEQRRFTERYNFDPVTDRPLPGRFEWMRMHP